mmetsp:Transcript_13228/g.26088  ORF Transcript_13228/g.26088 Transcript_13228/m.26088 type:complete len:260 (+) Transcript_13228:1566-2345(+)
MGKNPRRKERQREGIRESPVARRDERKKESKRKIERKGKNTQPPNGGSFISSSSPSSSFPFNLSLMPLRSAPLDEAKRKEERKARKKDSKQTIKTDREGKREGKKESRRTKARCHETTRGHTAQHQTRERERDRESRGGGKEERTGSKKDPKKEKFSPKETGNRSVFGSFQSCSQSLEYFTSFFLFCMWKKNSLSSLLRRQKGKVRGINFFLSFRPTFPSILQFVNDSKKREGRQVDKKTETSTHACMCAIQKDTHIDS